MASLGSDLVFGFQQVLFDLIILFFEGLGILDHFLGFLDQAGGTVWVTEPKEWLRWVDRRRTGIRSCISTAIGPANPNFYGHDPGTAHIASMGWDWL